MPSEPIQNGRSWHIETCRSLADRYLQCTFVCGCGSNFAASALSRLPHFLQIAVHRISAFNLTRPHVRRSGHEVFCAEVPRSGNNSMLSNQCSGESIPSNGGTILWHKSGTDEKHYRGCLHAAWTGPSEEPFFYVLIILGKRLILDNNFHTSWQTVVKQAFDNHLRAHVHQGEDKQKYQWVDLKNGQLNIDNKTKYRYSMRLCWIASNGWADSARYRCVFLTVLAVGIYVREIDTELWLNEDSHCCQYWSMIDRSVLVKFHL